MAFREFSVKSEIWIDLLIKKLKMAATTSKERKSINKEEIVNLAKKLCDDYIEDRLIRSGLQLKERKFVSAMSCESLQEDNDLEPGRVSFRPGRVSVTSSSLRKTSRSLSVGGSMANYSSQTSELHLIPEGGSLHGKSSLKQRRLHNIDKGNPSDLSCVLIAVGEILESRHAAVYSDVFTQLNIHLISEITLKRAFNGVAKQIFADGISWAKVVSLFAFTGAMAVDCVVNGANAYVSKLKNWTVQCITDDLSEWILLHDGWGGLVESFVKFQRPMAPIFLLSLFSLVVLFVAFLVKIILNSLEKT